jgi:hypothetical protein
VNGYKIYVKKIVYVDGNGVGKGVGGGVGCGVGSGVGSGVGFGVGLAKPNDLNSPKCTTPHRKTQRTEELVEV